MINDININKLNELIGNYDTPFFNYLLYSYDLSLNESEEVINDLKNDINSNNIIVDNMTSTLEDYFKSKVSDLEKSKKIEFLADLIKPDNDFYMKYLKKFNLSTGDIDLIYEKMKSKILKDNLSDFEIKRDLEYYFSNSVKQADYIKELDRIVGRRYDTLYISKAQKKYPILKTQDIVDIVFQIHNEIIEAKEFKNGILSEFMKLCLIKSEDKKAQCRLKLNDFVEGSGDSFLKLIKFKKLSKKDGEIIVSQIREDISKGLIQPEDINSVFITKRFNDYNERQ